MFLLSWLTDVTFQIFQVGVQSSWMNQRLAWVEKSGLIDATCHDLPRLATTCHVAGDHVASLYTVDVSLLVVWIYARCETVRHEQDSNKMNKGTHTQTWHDCGYRTFLISLYKADRMQIVFSRGGRAAERFFEQNGWSLCPKRIYATYNISKILQTCPNLVLGLVLWSGLNSLASFDFWLQR